MNNFIDFGHALGRSEMKKLMAGSTHDNGCYACAGGIDCYKIQPGDGLHGKTTCTDTGYPDYTCDQSGGSDCYVA